MRVARDRCALCLRKEPLRKSHIIPEFFYKQVYDENHTFLALSNDPTQPVAERPKGFYERLLCGPCETRTGRWDSYAYDVLKGERERQGSAGPGGVVVHDVDYVRFKLFAMSLLFRAAAATRPEFAAVDLGKRHCERLRAMLDSETPGPPDRYGFLLVFPPEREIQQLFRHVISPPVRVRFAGHMAYVFQLGLLVWVFFVSSHRSDEDIPLALATPGSLRALNGGRAVTGFLQSHAREIVRAEAGRRGEGRA